MMIINRSLTVPGCVKLNPGGNSYSFESQAKKMSSIMFGSIGDEGDSRPKQRFLYVTVNGGECGGSSSFSRCGSIGDETPPTNSSGL